jgi:hypothetical protein
MIWIDLLLLLCYLSTNKNNVFCVSVSVCVCVSVCASVEQRASCNKNTRFQQINQNILVVNWLKNADCKWKALLIGDEKGDVCVIYTPIVNARDIFHWCYPLKIIWVPVKILAKKQKTTNIQKVTFFE